MEAEAAAVTKYNAFRTSQADIEVIAKNLNIDPKIIRQIKDYVFYCTQHIFRDSTTGQFPASIEMAEVRERLIAGDFCSI